MTRLAEASLAALAAPLPFSGGPLSLPADPAEDPLPRGLWVSDAWMAAPLTTFAAATCAWPVTLFVGDAAADASITEAPLPRGLCVSPLPRGLWVSDAVAEPLTPLAAAVAFSAELLDVREGGRAGWGEGGALLG